MTSSTGESSTGERSTAERSPGENSTGEKSPGKKSTAERSAEGGSGLADAGGPGSGGAGSGNSGSGSSRGIAGAVRSVIARALRLRVVRAALLYVEHRGPMLADSITYRALFSVFAAVLLGFSIAALWLGGNPEAIRALGETLDAMIPGLSDVVDVERIDAFGAGFTLAGLASIAGLVGAAIGAIGSLRTAFLALDDRAVDEANGLLVALRKLLVALCFGGLLVFAAAASFLGGLGIGVAADLLGFSAGSAVGQTLTRVFGILIVFAIDTAAIALVFRLLSGVRAPRRGFWAGAVLGGAGLVVLQELSRSLFVRGAGANPLLGVFASLIALLLWFNLSAQVILVAASYIICSAHEAHDRVRTQHGASTLAQLNRQRAEDRLRAATEELRAAQEAERAELVRE